MSMEFLVSTFDKVSYLQNLLVARATEILRIRMSISIFDVNC